VIEGQKREGIEYRTILSIISGASTYEVHVAGKTVDEIKIKKLTSVIAPLSSCKRKQSVLESGQNQRKSLCRQRSDFSFRAFSVFR
jgi:hypothetical protein